MLGADIAQYRDDFPILQQQVNGKPVAFLDSAASAQKPRCVIDKVSSTYEKNYANIHRGLYNFSQVTTKEYEAVRSKVAAFIGAPSEREIIFTRNATEAINLVAQSWGREFLSEGDEIILTDMEHHANIVPWQLLASEIGLTIKVIPVLDDGALDIDEFRKMLSPKTKLLSFTHISNSLGTINDAAQLTHIAKDFYPEMKVLVDGSQAVVHRTVNLTELGCDFYVFTGHKLYGPSGVGVLWGRGDVLADMPPYQGGGDMIETVSWGEITFKEAPARFEAGTPAIVQTIGLGAAIDYVSNIGMDAIQAHEVDLLAYAMDQLKQVDGLTFYGTAAEKAGIISFTAEWGHTSDVGTILDQCGVAVRTGHHCCMPLMQRFDIDGTIRASFGLYSNRQDVDALVGALNKAKRMLG